MPAKSKAQQRFMAMVHKKQTEGGKASPKVNAAAKSMSADSSHDFAATRRKGLPAHHHKKGSFDAALVKRAVDRLYLQKCASLAAQACCRVADEAANPAARQPWLKAASYVAATGDLHAALTSAFPGARPGDVSRAFVAVVKRACDLKRAMARLKKSDDMMGAGAVGPPPAGGMAPGMGGGMGGGMDAMDPGMGNMNMGNDMGGAAAAPPPPAAPMAPTAPPVTTPMSMTGAPGGMPPGIPGGMPGM